MSGVHLSFYVLGPLEVRRGGRVLELGTPKQRVVLATLLVAGGTPCSVDRLTAQVWDRPPRDPLRSLQVYVSGLRAALADDGTLLRTLDRAYRLEPPEGAVDADRVRVLAGRAGELLRAGGPGDTGRSGAAAALELVEEALGTWRGEAWAGLRHVPVVDAAARRLDRLQRELRTMRGEAMLGLGRHREVLADLEDLVVDHPEDDALLGLLLLALHRSGQRDEALARFRETRARRVAETGLEPGEPVRRLHQQLLVDDPRLAHQPADLAQRRHLPEPATPLLGRRHEVAEVARAVRGARLVTVTGPGGVGKTRVALQAAHDLAVDFPDGVWFVPLAAVRDPLLLPQVVAEVLGLDDPREPARAVRAHLAARRLLLLTDNLEQVVDGTPWLGELLTECRGLRVLATSRVPLRLYGEHLTALDGLAPADAVRLLHERAAAAGHGPAVAATDPLDLVQALDLLPLAIELVAARLDEVATGDLGSGLRTRLAAAVDGPRDRTARQQTLRGAIAWSTDLLPARARVVFAELGVFEGGFETTDALAVTQTDQDTLELLCRASLVRAPVGGRARMLETVREVALELLEETADPDTVRDRHAAQVQVVVSAAIRDLRAGAGEEIAAATRRLRAEQANCRAALGWLAARVPTRPDCGERLLLLAADLSVHWYRTTPGSEDVSWLERALDVAPDADPVLRARACHGLAICRGEQGRTDEALRHSRESLHLFRSAGDLVGTARAANTLGGLLRDLGRAAQALPFLEESLALRRRLDDPALPVALALGNLALSVGDAGDHPRARRCLEECLDLVGEEEPERSLATVTLAGVALDQADPDEAGRLLAGAVPRLREHDVRYRMVEALDVLAALAAHTGEPALAATLLAAADRATAEDDAELTLGDRAVRERRVLGPLRGCEDGPSSGPWAEGTRRGQQLELAAALDLACAALLT